MINAATLRQHAEEEAARLPALLARAEHLATTVLLGAGRQVPVMGVGVGVGVTGGNQSGH